MESLRRKFTTFEEGTKVIESIAPVLTSIKNAGPPIYGAVLVASALLLFLPDPLIAHIGLAEIRAQYLTYEGLTLLGSASLLVVSAVPICADLVRKRYGEWKFDKGARDILSSLTEDEKVFLRKYVINGENTVYSSISDGVAQGLTAKGIVFRASNVGIPGPGMRFAYNMQPFARRMLAKRRQLLD
jgi:hypothetical protein